MNEMSELFAVDIAFGTYILSAFTGFSATNGPKEFQEFIARASNQKVFRHQCDGVAAFLKNYLSDAKAVTSAAGATPARVNVAKLPVIYYYRKPGLVSDADNIDGPFNQWVKRYAGADDTDMRLRMLISRDKASLDRMSIAWFSLVSQSPVSDRFKIHYEIAGNPIELKATVKNCKTCILDDASITDESGRFYAVTGKIDVSAPVIIGDAVEIVDPMRIQYGFDIKCGTIGGF